MGWGSFLKSTLRLGGRMTSATAHTVGSAVLHPQQTLKGVGTATKSAVLEEVSVTSVGRSSPRTKALLA